MPQILVIDDDKDTCEFLKDFFEIRKCIVFTAHSGADGISIVKKEKPEIVLLDIKMEGMDGLETLKKIKSIDRSIKVVMVTVASDKEYRQKALELGADDFIKKPLNSSYLEGVVCKKVSSLPKEGGKTNDKR